MKRLKKEISLLLVLALVVSSLTMGFGQIKADAYSDITGTGIFRVDISVHSNDDTYDTCGTGSKFQLKLLNAAGGVVSATPVDVFDGSSSNNDGTVPLQNGQTTSFTYNGVTNGKANQAVPSLGTLLVSKTIAQVQLVNTTWVDNWYFTSVKIFYTPDGGTNWVTLANNSWNNLGSGYGGGTPYATATWAVSYFSSNYKALTFNANGGNGGVTYDAIAGQTISAPANPTKAGDTFAGWSPSVPARMPNANTTYTAQWTPTTRNITFDANGGTGGTGPISMAIGSALTAPTVTKEGYTFIAWSPLVPSAVAGSNKTYTAVWLANGESNTNTYNITFNPNGGSGTMPVQSLLFCQTADLSNNAFTKTGYTFLGWATSQAIANAGTTEYLNGENCIITNDITLYAVWKVILYTITFDANGGTGCPGPTQMQPGTSLSSPTVIKTYYSFAGWSPAIPATVPAADTTYTAQWTANQYTITFDAQGGSVLPATSAVKYGSTYGAGTGGFPIPTRTGYIFSGWYSKDIGYETKILGSTPVRLPSAQTLYAHWITSNSFWLTFKYNYGNGGGYITRKVAGSTLTAPTVNRTGYSLVGWSPALPATVPAADTTYTAQWTTNTYTVTYYGNGSTGGSTARSTHTYDVSKALTTNGFTKTGYTFWGWSYSASASSIAYMNSQSVQNLSFTANGNISLYALWLGNQYTITFDANNGTGSKSSTMSCGAALTAPTVTKAGYVFNGWSPSVPSSVPAANTTFTAQWTPANRAITFDANGGTGGTGPTSMAVGSALTAPAVTKDGYTFIGWSPSVPTSVPGVDKTYTVVWLANGDLNENTYNITFDSNGGSGTMPAQSLGFGIEAALAANTFTKTGYTFIGWATSQAIANTDTAEYLNGANYTVSNDITLYAVWKANICTITFDANGGTGDTGPSFQMPGTTLSPPTVTKTGYTFACWSPSAPSTVPAANTTYTAQWTANTYTVTFNGTSVPPKTSIVTFGSTYGAGTGGLPTPVWTGFTFTGWSGNSVGSVSSTTIVTYPSSVTLSSNWHVIVYTVYFDGNGNTGGSTASQTFPYNTVGALTANGYTKTGYTFEGWATSADGPIVYYDNQSVGQLSAIDGDAVTLYAKWNDANVYTITFNANEGQGGTNDDMTCGSPLTAPTVTRTGYTFAGWTPSVPSTVPAADISYTAQWIEGEAIIITFNANGGSGGTSGSMVYGAALTAPTVTKADCIFASWSPAVPATVPAASTTYTAQWTTIAPASDFTYTVSGTLIKTTTITKYLGVSGGNIIIPSTLGGGTVTTIGSNAFSSDNAGLTGVIIPDTVTTIGSSFVSCNELTAITIGKGVTTIASNAFGCDNLTQFIVNNENNNFSSRDGVLFNKNKTTLIRFPSGLAGDYLIPDGVTAIGSFAFRDCKKITSLTIPASVTSIFCVSNASIYNNPKMINIFVDSGNDMYSSQDGVLFNKDKSTIIKFPNGRTGGYTIPDGVTKINDNAFSDCNGLTSVIIPESVTVISNSAFSYCDGLTNITLPSNLISIGGWVFSWSDNLTRVYFLGNAPSMGEYVFYGVASDFSICYLSDKTGFTYPWYGYSTGIYSINTFDANGGTGGSSNSITYGTTLTAPTVTRTGYTLAGWLPTVPATAPAVNTTYTAQWTAKTYTVTFNPQSGSVSPTSSTVTYNSTYGAGTGGIPTPTRTGYTFGGWFTGTGGAGTNVLSTTAVTITAAQTLYAKWIINYAITFDANGGTEGTSSLLAYGSTLSAPIVTKTGYTLSGWSPAIPATVPAADTTYTAQWSINNYTIAFDANGGTGGTSGSMTYGATLTAPAVTRASYVFIGWSQAVPATVGPENANFSALWNLLGDLNSSDSITPIDALMTLQAASGKITLTDIQRLAADIDSSGTISPIDALKILQYTSGKISSFEI